MNVRRISAVGVAALAAGGLTGGTMGTGEQLGWVPQTVTVDEGAGHAVLTVQRDMCQTGRFRVGWWAPWDVTADTASRADYQSGFGSHTFEQCASGSEDQTTVTIPIVDDDEEELDEHFSVGLRVERVSTNDTNPLPEAGARQARVVIRDDDGGVRLATEDVTVKEEDGVARVTLTPSGIGEPTWIDVRTSDGTAEAGDDYTPRDDAFQVETDEPVTVDVPLAVDGDREDDETFQVTFGYGEESASATVTITDPPPPTQTQTTPTQTTPATTTPPPATTPAPAATPTPAPSPAPAPKQQAQRSATAPPARCVSRRRFSLSLARYRSATVRLGGRRLRTTRSAKGRLVARIDLRGRPKGRFTVTISGRTTRGGKRTETRRYRTCTPRGRGTERNR